MNLGGGSPSSDDLGASHYLDPWERAEAMLAEIAAVLVQNRELVAKMQQEDEDGHDRFSD